MSPNGPRPVERHCDVAVVGGSATGLAAALQLGRQRRSVIVVDAGDARNAGAAHMHGFLSRDGAPPSEVTGAGREEVRGYGSEVLSDWVVAVVGTEEGRFRLRLASGHTIIARRVLAATGLVDVIPDINGLAEHWGHDVIHCPFCHGFEVRDRRLVQIVTHPSGLHTAALWRQLTSRLTVVVEGDVAVGDSHLDSLRAAGVDVRSGQVRRVVSGPDGTVIATELADGARIATDAVAVSPGFRVRAEPFAPLGLQPVAHPSGLGDVVQTDPTGATAVPGLYAAGNLTDPTQQFLAAAAHGNWVGAMISFSLADEDLREAARPSANQTDWDHRYGEEQMWSGNPNGALVGQISGMTPGRALDVGAGEGGDAIWLAEQGWQVVATDISRRALDRIAAAHGTLPVECRLTDANALHAFDSAAFDLVSVFYASIPRTPDSRGVRNLLDAVAPGGILLVVNHDIEAMRAPTEGPAHSFPFDPDAYVGTNDVAAALTGAADWAIEMHEKRPRPPGPISTHHLEDVILRARRKNPTDSPGGPSEPVHPVPTDG
jgi:thioredoxin reductase/SAM-dependent methyltransferase